MPPELTQKMPAMRELAQLSAQSSLSTHAKARRRRAIQAKILLGLASLVAGAVLLSFYFRMGWTPAYYGACAAALLAVFELVQVAILKGVLAVSRSGHLQWARRGANDDAAEESPADDAPEAPTDG